MISLHLQPPFEVSEMPGTTREEIRTLKIGRYVCVDDEAYKILSISKSKPGKHGSAKARIEMANIFTNFTKIIDIAKEGLPTKVKQEIDVYQVMGSNILANQRAFQEAKKRGFK